MFMNFLFKESQISVKMGWFGQPDQPAQLEADAQWLPQGSERDSLTAQRLESQKISRSLGSLDISQMTQMKFGCRSPGVRVSFTGAKHDNQ